MSTRDVSSLPARSVSNCHAGHRKRMRERCQRVGLTGLAIHEIVEMLLFVPLRRINTNPIAHKLLDTYGSIEALLRHAVEDTPNSFGGQKFLANLERSLLAEVQNVPRPAPLTMGQIYVLSVYHLRRYPDRLLFICCSGDGALQHVELLFPTAEALTQAIRQCRAAGGLWHLAALHDTYPLSGLRSDAGMLLELQEDLSPLWI